MKKVLFCLTLAGLSQSPLHAQVAIGTTSPDASAALELNANDKGFLPPRLTNAQRDAIANPAEGLTVYNTESDCLESFNGSYWTSLCVGTVQAGACAGEPTEFTFNGLTYKPVESNGKCWLDRNLGASQVANAPNDNNSYGDLYQWGRAADGHQLRSLDCSTADCFDAQANNSNLPLTAADVTNATWNGKFIYNVASPSDWHQDNPDNTLWQGVNGTNNPCPSGYRLPTVTEWDAERALWSSGNSAGAIASPLKLPPAGLRISSDGKSGGDGSGGYYWSSTVSGNQARLLIFGSAFTLMGDSDRAQGFSVRCLKD